jgi:hypothetical protein
MFFLYCKKSTFNISNSRSRCIRVYCTSITRTLLSPLFLHPYFTVSAEFKCYLSYTTVFQWYILQFLINATITVLGKFLRISTCLKKKKCWTKLDEFFSFLGIKTPFPHTKTWKIIFLPIQIQLFEIENPKIDSPYCACALTSCGQ